MNLQLPSAGVGNLKSILLLGFTWSTIVVSTAVLYVECASGETHHRSKPVPRQSRDWRDESKNMERLSLSVAELEASADKLLARMPKPAAAAPAQHQR